jgi:hypothetical protein
MVQFATPEHQKGKKEKPKKELGGWMDIVQMIAPIAASFAGTPLAGAAVSALLEGAESKLEGGSWKEALTKGAISGGTSALGGAVIPGADKVAGEVTKKVGEGAVTGLGGEALKEGAKQGGAFGLGLTADAAGNLVKEGAMDRAMSGLADESMKSFTNQMAGAAAGAGAGAVGDASAKQKFIEHATELGNMGLEAHMASKAEGQERMRSSQMMNQALMQRIQGAMQGEYQRPKGSRFYKPYGG